MDPSTDQERFQCCFKDWLQQQEVDLGELLRTMANTTTTSSHTCDNELRSLVATNMQHYQDYLEKRRVLAREDALSFINPAWCTSFENSFLWIGGCRPSMAIRLVYTITGAKMEAHLDEFLNGERRGDLGELSAQQLGLVNGLHCRILREEEKLCSRLASLQEEVADKPLVPLARNRAAFRNREAIAAMGSYEGLLASIMEEADKLRMETLKEVVAILTPLQAVEILAAAKQLHLSVHDWGLKRDRARGRE